MWLLFLAAALVASSSQANALASTPSDAANVQNFPDENVGFRESHSLSLAQQELVLPQPDIRHTRWPISPFALAAPVAVVVFLIFYCALRLMRTNNYTTTTQRRRLASEESGPCSPLGDKGPDSDPLMKTEAYSPHKKQLGKLLLTSEDAMCLTLEEKLSVADARKILGDLLNEIELLEAQLDSLGSKHRSLQKMLELPPEHGGPETSSQKDTMQIMLQETLDKMEEVKSNLQGRKRRANTMIWTTGQTTQELLLWARYFGMGRLLSPSAAAAFAARDVVFGASGDKQTVLLDEVAKVSVKSLVQHLIDEGNACTDLLSRDAFPSDEEVDRAKRSLRDLTSLVPQLGLVEPAYGLSGQLERTTEALKSLEAAMVKWQELLSSQNPTSRIDVQPSGVSTPFGDMGPESHPSWTSPQSRLSVASRSSWSSRASSAQSVMGFGFPYSPALGRGPAPRPLDGSGHGAVYGMLPGASASIGSTLSVASTYAPSEGQPTAFPWGLQRQFSVTSHRSDAPGGLSPTKQYPRSQPFPHPSAPSTPQTHVPPAPPSMADPRYSAPPQPSSSSSQRVDVPPSPPAPTDPRGVPVSRTRPSSQHSGTSPAPRRTPYPKSASLPRSSRPSTPQVHGPPAPPSTADPRYSAPPQPSSSTSKRIDIPPSPPAAADPQGVPVSRQRPSSQHGGTSPAPRRIPYPKSASLPRSSRLSTSQVHGPPAPPSMADPRYSAPPQPSSSTSKRIDVPPSPPAATDPQGVPVSRTRPSSQHGGTSPAPRRIPYPKSASLPRSSRPSTPQTHVPPAPPSMADPRYSAPPQPSSSTSQRIDVPPSPPAATDPRGVPVSRGRPSSHHGGTFPAPRTVAYPRSASLPRSSTPSTPQARFPAGPLSATDPKSGAPVLPSSSTAQRIDVPPSPVATTGPKRVWFSDHAPPVSQRTDKSPMPELRPQSGGEPSATSPQRHAQETSGDKISSKPSKKSKGSKKQKPEKGGQPQQDPGSETTPRSKKGLWGFGKKKDSKKSQPVTPPPPSATSLPASAPVPPPTRIPVPTSRAQQQPASAPGAQGPHQPLPPFSLPILIIPPRAPTTSPIPRAPPLPSPGEAWQPQTPSPPPGGWDTLGARPKIRPPSTGTPTSPSVPTFPTAGYTQQLGAQFTGPGPHAAPPISPPSSASATTKPPTPLPPMQDEPPPPRPAVTMPGPVEPPATQDPSPGVALPPAQTPASPIQLQSDSPSAEGRAQTPPVPAAAPMTAPVPAVSATSLTSPSAGSDALAPPWAYILSDPRDLPPHASLSSSGFAAEEALLPPSSLGSSSSGDARESEAALPAAVQLPSSTGDEAQHSEEATSEEDKQQSEPEGLPHPPPDISTADAGLGEEWPPPPSEAEFDEMEGPSGDDHSAGEPPPPPPPEDGQQQPGDSPAPPGEPSSPPGGQSAPPGDDPPPPGQPPVPQGKPSEEGGLDANEEIKELIDKLSDFVLTASSVEASLQSNAKHLKEAEGLFTSGTALIQLAKGHTPSPTADPTVMSELEHQLGKCSETCSSLQESCRSWQEKLSDRTLGLSLKIEETQDGWRKPSSELPTLGFVSCIEELVNAAKEVETLFEHLKLLEGPFAEALDLKETLTTASEAISAAKEEASLAASHCASVYRKTLQKGSFVGSEGAGPGPGPLGGEYPMLETAKSVSTRLGALGLGGEALQALGEAVSKIEVTRL